MMLTIFASKITGCYAFLDYTKKEDNDTFPD